MAGQALTPHYQDDSVTLWLGDSLKVLWSLPDQSVDCCVTSPPYFGLRDYGETGQYGLESTPSEYVETMRLLFVEVWRVLTDDGTLWLNIGDSYVASRGQGNVGGNLEGGPRPSFRGGRESVSATRAGVKYGLPNKSMVGIPWRVAFALQDSGWILRNDIIWNKPNAMPESVTDRLSNRHEHLFLLTKQANYWFDLDPIREPLAHPDKTGHAFGGNHPEVSSTRGGIYQPKRKAADESWNAGTGLTPHAGHRGTHERGRNPGDVWTISTKPFSDAHFATMPLTLAERCVQAGCRPDGTVLDPFSGSGTTGLAAARNGRKYVGIDLSSDYLDLSLRTRLAQSALDFGESA